MSSFQDRMNQRRELKREVIKQKEEEQRLLDSTIPTIYGIMFTDIKESFSYGERVVGSSFYGAKKDDIGNLGNCIDWDFKSCFLDWLSKERAENELENFTDNVEEDGELKEFFLGSHSVPKSVAIKTDDDSGILLMNELAAQIFSKTDFSLQRSAFSKEEWGDPVVEIVSAVLSLLEQIHLHYGLSPFYRKDSKSAHDITTCIICGCPDHGKNPYGINISASNVSAFFEDIKTFIKQKDLLKMPGTRGPFFKDFQYNGTAKQAAAYYSNEKDVELRLLNGQYGVSADEAKKIIEQCKLRFPRISAIAYTCAKCGTDAVDAEIYRCDECGEEFCSKCTPIKREIKAHYTYPENEKYLLYGLYKCPFCGESSDCNLSAVRSIPFLIENSKSDITITILYMKTADFRRIIQPQTT